MLAQILGYLNPSDRREAALVSRTWHQASQESGLQEKRVYGMKNLLKGNVTIENRKGLRLTLDNLNGFLGNGKDNFYAKCKGIGSNITELVFNGSDITGDLLVALLLNCHELEKLDLSGANSLFMSGQFLSYDSDVQNLQKSLANVRSLSLANIRYLSNATFTKIAKTCANLENLSLAGCPILFHSKSYIGDKVAGISTANSAVLTFEVIKKYITQLTPSLTGLDLSNTGITNEAVYNLITIPDLKLKELNLSSCKELTDKAIGTVCNFQRGIENINISNNEGLTDVALVSISENLQGLTCLSVGKLDQLTEESVTRLSQLKKLQKVDLSSCVKVTNEGLIKSLCGPYRENLLHLNISGCIKVADGFLVQLTTAATNLIHLDVSYTGITDCSLYVIAAKLKYLRQLNLAYCRELTDYGILGIERPMEDMKRPPIVQHDDGECTCTRKYQLSSVFTKPMKNQEFYQKATCIPLCQLGLTCLVPLTNIEGLRELDLTGCLQMTDNGLAMALKFQEMKVLKLDLCGKITDKALIAMSDRLPSVEKLSLSQCNKITDDGVVAVVKNMKRLMSLNLQGCDKVTNKTVDAICIHAYRLKMLNVKFCKNITSTGLEQLEKHRASLVQV